jgi:hypothetical protein
MVQKRAAVMIWPTIIQRDVLGIRFAINVFIGSTITWYTLSRFADTNPIWAIASMIAASGHLWLSSRPGGYLGYVEGLAHS